MCLGKISSFICIAELVTSTQLVVILDSFPADLKDLIGWKGLWISSAHLHFPGQLGGLCWADPWLRQEKPQIIHYQQHGDGFLLIYFKICRSSSFPGGSPSLNLSQEKDVMTRFTGGLKQRQIFEFRTLLFPDGSFLSLKGHMGPT